MAKKNIDIDENELKAMMMGMGVGQPPIVVAASATQAPPAVTTTPPKKKERTEVDEVVVHEVEQQQAGGAEVTEVEDSAMVKPEMLAKNTLPPVKHKKGSYEALFLTKNIVKTKQSEQGVLRVLPDVHKRLTTAVLAAHGNSIGLVDYVSNVIVNHLNKYKEDLQYFCVERQKEIVF